MEKLNEISSKLLRSTSLSFVRYLHDQIDWRDRLIAIKGGRGTGKTTLLLQRIKSALRSSPEALYVSLDDIYFTSHTVVDLVDDFAKTGGKFLFLDEVHKYPTWSREIKNIYDSHPELMVVFTGSSMLQITKGDADLSRRAVVYELQGLSFREYLALEKKIILPRADLQSILDDHTNIASDVLAAVRPLSEFNNYLTFGYYPYFIENKDTYHSRLLNTINLIIESDLPAIEKVDYSTIQKLKKLLYIISTSVPFKPNIQKLSEQIHASRSSTLLYLDHLKNAQLLNLLRSETEGVSYLNKPDKIYLNNPNMLFALAPENANTGTLRETFFFNQVQKVAAVTSAEPGDFKVKRKFTFEIGGKDKTPSQLKNVKNGFVAADGIETGFQIKIPLWLFGFLY